MHSGYQGANDALDYYESTDWITEEVQSDLAESTSAASTKPVPTTATTWASTTTCSAWCTSRS